MSLMRTPTPCFPPIELFWELAGGVSGPPDRAIAELHLSSFARTLNSLLRTQKYLKRTASIADPTAVQSTAIPNFHQAST